MIILGICFGIFLLFLAGLSAYRAHKTNNEVYGIFMIVLFVTGMMFITTSFYDLIVRIFFKN